MLRRYVVGSYEAVLPLDVVLWTNFQARYTMAATTAYMRSALLTFVTGSGMHRGNATLEGNYKARDHHNVGDSAVSRKMVAEYFNVESREFRTST
jgi:hypothetical protein